MITRLLIGLWILVPVMSRANNIKINRLQFVNTTTINLQLSWENSWNLEGEEAPANHDAAWLFLKCGVQGVNGITTWPHLDVVNAQLQSGNATLAIPADGKGIWVKTGKSSLNATTASLQLTIAAPANATIVKAFATEMVWVNEGSFYAGDSISYNAIKNGKQLPLYITGRGAIKPGTGSSNLDSSVTGNGVSATFPKGYNGFYIMKYEISQEQYADYLNCTALSTQPGQEPASLFTNGLAHRNGLVIYKQGNQTMVGCNLNGNGMVNEPNDGQTLACNYLSWKELQAWLDWSALRPFTELEFEKACRGPLKPLEREFAWGTQNAVDANVIDSANLGTDKELALELCRPGAGLTNHALPVGSTYYVPGPLRCGFAARPGNNRICSGAGYYGAMDLSGNLWEVAINCNNTFFIPENGDGDLTTTPHWVETVSNGNATNYKGLIIKGGGWLSLVYNNLNYQFRDLAISDRFYKNYNHIVNQPTTGGRGCRYAE